MTKKQSATLPAYEKLGAFYLGRGFDPDQGATTQDLVLYDAKDLTTHAVCVGMTGSGKTGLCIGLLEEAAIDGIPAIAIDPKGDLGNLALTFPKLRKEDFLPWIDPGEKVWPIGGRAPIGSPASAKRPTSRSIRPAAPPDCRSPSSSRCHRRRRNCSTTRRRSGSA